MTSDLPALPGDMSPELLTLSAATTWLNWTEANWWHKGSATMRRWKLQTVIITLKNNNRRHWLAGDRLGSRRWGLTCDHEIIIDVVDWKIYRVETKGSIQPAQQDCCSCCCCCCYSPGRRYHCDPSIEIHWKSKGQEEGNGNGTCKYPKKPQTLVSWHSSVFVWVWVCLDTERPARLTYL